MVTFVERLDRLVGALARLNDEFDAATLGPDGLLAAGEAYGRLVRMAQGGATLLAAAVDDAGAFRRAGERSAADWLARHTGVNAGAAHRVVETGRRLAQRPAVEAAVRRGEVSAEQAEIITEAAAGDEAALLDVSRRRSVKGLRQEAARRRAARESEAAAMVRYRAAHHQRHLRSWVDGARFCFTGSTTLDDGARLMGALETERTRLFAQAQAEGRRESNDAYLLDALVNVVVGTAPAPKARAALTVRADKAALDRGHLVAGERCGIDGYGPIPITIARALVADADVHHVVFGHNGALYDVSSTKRTIPAALRRALDALYPCCAADGCDQTLGLEIDHIQALADGGRTELQNLWRLCRRHHRLKTLGALVVTGSPGSWRLEPAEVRRT